MFKLHRLTQLGQYHPLVDAALDEMARDRTVERIWAGDHTVWKPEPAEIANRLGWLHSAETMSDNLPQIEALVNAVRADGYTHALLLGMGGSSLAPEVFRKTFGVKQGYLDLAVLDSTDPGAVLAYAERLEPARTLYIVSTKSGGTVETFSFFKFFYNRAADAVGRDKAGQHFIAITDPGSKLAETAERYFFRDTFLNDPNIGGRYSALSYFGLVPAALVGVDVLRLLDRAFTAASRSGPGLPINENPAAWLGAVLGELAKAGRDKVTFVTSPAIASFGDWVEQLIAESTGKEGRGILPVVGESLATPEAYADDRLFVHLELEGDESDKAALKDLGEAGHPIVRLRLQDLYDLGGQFFLWELATAVAGYRLGINPFDQPNVELAKVLAREMVAAYQREGNLPELRPTLRSGEITAYAESGGEIREIGETPGEALRAFLTPSPVTSHPSLDTEPALSLPKGHSSPRSYVALQAYVRPTPETDAALHALRTEIQTRWRSATTVGYGPRFLHSTGQLHKGDAGNGLFIQFTADDPHDAPIPDEAGAPDSSMTFGVLKAAQALGDRQALLDAGRHVIRFYLGSDALGGLRKLGEALWSLFKRNARRNPVSWI